MAYVHKNFFKFFSKNQMQEILKKAFIVDDTFIFIITTKHYFTLYADAEKGVEIFYDEKSENSEEKKTDKELFLKLLGKSLKAKIQCVEVREA